MQTNLPVSQNEYLFPETDLLVSTTDTRGHITHCNEAFMTTSGFSYEELIGQPHNLIRHPDMPEAAFKDMWRTIGRGQPWTGMVKNRRKNGDYYWVEANVTPIMEAGKPKGYMSVRVQPSRAQVEQAQKLYAQLHLEKKAGKRPSVRLQEGLVCQRGIRGWPARLRSAPLTAWLAAATAVIAGLALLPDVWGWQGGQALATRAAVLALGLGAVLTWFHWKLSAGLADAVRFAGELSACNLASRPALGHAEPLGGLMRRLHQIQVNLRAVVGDVRREMEGFSTSAGEIAQGSLDLSARTETQASNLEETAASMEELASIVRQSADTAEEVCQHSEASTALATRGEHAVEQAGQAMAAIAQSSRQIGDISDLIESIAFQTNILSLNAAIEAARAGEQGRGFTVVASEVRALANRSSSAAKEIRQLIAQAQARTAEGSKRIEGAGEVLHEVRRSVQQVGAMVRQISEAAHEQSQGISQVNEAVSQLDGVTQQNAALVEESTAAATALTHSAQALQNAVSVFQISTAASATPAPTLFAVPTAARNSHAQAPHAHLLAMPSARAVPARRPELRAA
ncbi:methyl-accepting chemotaxis protein [Variovorax sp. HJSM1_2]|uniref:methyl-accepting chemotaxis protein n=1 Tax=Variovorax sp. HJSM1_2 TaxID=3366263 RepID=UPI003BE3D252